MRRSLPGAFPDPYSIAAPAGAEDWTSAYPYYNLFLEARRTADSARTWFRDVMHFPEPLPPFDVVVADSAFLSTGVMNTRVFALPPALGIDVRLVNGYLYMSTRAVTDEAELAGRTAEFAQRAGHYYRNWPQLYARWEREVRRHIDALDAITIPDLPAFEPLDRVLADTGVTTANDLLVAYQAILASVDATWNLHSELLNLGYAAYLNFLTLCRNHFPELTDQQAAAMVSGVDVLLLRPDEELKHLARLAVDLDLAAELTAVRPPQDLFAVLAQSDPGRRWRAAWDAAADPWFHFSNGNGFYHHHGSWSDDPAFPLAALRGYVTRLVAGEDLARPADAVAEQRDGVVDAVRALLAEADRQTFDDALSLCRTVFPFVENHNFYVEHWYMTRFWAKVREVGALLHREGFFTAVDDVFFLRRSEVADALVDLQIAWCAGSPAQGPAHWPAVVAERRRVHDVLRRWTPPPVLGPAPDAIVEPVTIMLWGITDQQVRRWLDAQADQRPVRALDGYAASPGVAEGPARVVLDLADLDDLQDGEVLVAPITSPSWTPVFARIRAAVSDIGGIMCHAAIVSREYGLPAVVGTGSATSTIRTGQRVRVDGTAGTVTLLD